MKERTLKNSRPLSRTNTNTVHHIYRYQVPEAEGILELKVSIHTDSRIVTRLAVCRVSTVGVRVS